VKSGASMKHRGGNQGNLEKIEDVVRRGRRSCCELRFILTNTTPRP